MYQLLGIPDPTPGAGYEQFFANVPDTSWIQARGIMPQQTMTGNMGPQQPMVGYPTGGPQMFGQPQTMDPTQNPYALAQKAYEDSHIHAIQSMDPTKFSHAQDVENYLLNQPDQSLAQNPRVLAAAKSAQAVSKQFQQYAQRYPKAASVYASEIKSGKSPEEALDTLRGTVADEDEQSKLAYMATDKGVDLNDPSLRDKSGKLNGLAVHGAVFRAEQAAKQTRIPLGKEDRDAFHEAMDAVNEAQNFDSSTDAMKQAKADLISLGKAKGYTDAHEILKKKALDSATQNLQTLVHTYEGSNHALSPLYYHAAGMDVPDYSSTGRGRQQMTPRGNGAALVSPTGSPPTGDPFSGPERNGGPEAPQAPAGPPTQTAAVAPPAGESVTPVASMSPADLTKNDLYNLPVSLEDKIASQKAQDQNKIILQAQAESASKALQASRIKNFQQQEAADLPQYQNAWSRIKSSMLPSDLERPYEDFADDTFIGALNSRNADNKINPQAVAFKDSKGRPVLWRDVVGKFRNSPHFDALKGTLSYARPEAKNISGIVQVSP